MTLKIVIVACFVLASMLFAAVEIVLIPGFGIPGILGIVLGVSAVISAFNWFGPIWGIAVLLGLTVISWWVARWFPNSSAGKRLILHDAQGRGAGQEHFQQWLHQEGTAVTPLRPAGSIEIAQTRIDVVTEGSYVEVGQKVKVIEVRGNRIVVEPLD